MRIVRKCREKKGHVRPSRHDEEWKNTNMIRGQEMVWVVGER